MRHNSYRAGMNFDFKIKALLGMLARLPWRRRDLLGSINGKHDECMLNMYQ